MSPLEPPEPLRPRAALSTAGGRGGRPASSRSGLRARPSSVATPPPFPRARPRPLAPGACNPGEVSGCQFPPFHACFAGSIRLQWAPSYRRQDAGASLPSGRPQFFRADSATVQLSEVRGERTGSGGSPEGVGAQTQPGGQTRAFLKEAFANSGEGRRGSRQEARYKLTSLRPPDNQGKWGGGGRRTQQPTGSGCQVKALVSGWAVGALAWLLQRGMVGCGSEKGHSGCGRWRFPGATGVGEWW